MLSKGCSAAVNGIDAHPVEVEVNEGYGDTLIVVVGLPDAAVKESKDRVSTALANSGCKFPMGRTTINLAPGRRQGPGIRQARPEYRRRRPAPAAGVLNQPIDTN
jgi:magnesium chelatase family protein